MAAPALKLRPETLEDRSRVATLIARTYLTAGARMIETTGLLRELPTHKEDLALIGCNDQKEVLAYALFSPLQVGNQPEAALLLAPLAMDTLHDEVNYEGFLNQCLEDVRRKGYRYVMMHGDLEQYRHMGFEDAEAKGVESDIHYPGAALLLIDFEDAGKSTLKGKVHYPDFISA